MGDCIRKIFFLALIVLLAVSAGARSLEQHGITVSVGPEGSASIQEKYFFSFADANELDSFKKEVKKNGPNFIAWKLFDERIFPSIAPQGDELAGKSVSFDEASSYLELKYALTTKFMRAEEQARTTVFTLIQNRLNSFIQAASFTIPKNTSITLIIPENSRLIKVLPTP
ncbi:hypothetical protein HZB89_02060, partial [archaeon]|nr:hypothetical protein [archaeon]